MGFLSKALNTKNLYEKAPGYELGRSISSSGFANIFGSGGDDINVLEEFSGFVWKAINVRAEELSSVDFYVQRKVADQWQDDQSHEFNTVMAGSDGGLDEAEFIEAHQIYMDMYGESFWYFSKGQTSSKPFDRYLLEPNYMTVMIGGGKITGYVYQKDGDRIVFDLEEIAHFRIYDPRNPYRGTGPMQKAGWFIRSSRYATTFVNNFLENNAIPAGVVVAKNAVDDNDWELFKQQWKSNYGGISNSGKTAFVRGNDLEFIKTGISLGDVDFDKVTTSSKEDILEMFSVPKSKLGDFGSFNKASATESEAMWGKTFTKPAVSRIIRKVSRKVAVWYGTEFRYGSDFEIPEDRVTKLAEFEKGTNVWITVNEARAAYGLPKLGTEYDSLQVSVATPPALPKSLGKLTIKTVEKNTKAGFSYEMKESFRKTTEDVQIKYESKLFQAVNPVLEAQKRSVLDQLQPKKVADTQFDVAAEAKALEDVIIPIMIELAKEQGALAIKFVTDGSLAFEVTPVTRLMIQQSIQKAVSSLTEATQLLIAETVSNGLQAGDSIATIAKEIDKVYSDLLGVKQPGYRTDRLVRTEVIKGSNTVTELAYKQSGVVKKKEWFANPGHCEFCDSLNGSVISLGSSFVPQGSSVQGSDGGTYKADYENVHTPPIHPNCRCTLIPVIE